MFRNPFGRTARVGSIVLGAALAGVSFTPLFPPVVAAASIAPTVFRPALVPSPVLAMPAKVKPTARLLSIGSPLAGMASWYGTEFEGRRAADGSIFDGTKMTAAHNTLPFGTRVRVVSVDTGRSVIVKITDRGLLPHNRLIDLSSGAAESLGILSQGVARVRIQVVKREVALEKDLSR